MEKKELKDFGFNDDDLSLLNKLKRKV